MCLFPCHSYIVITLVGNIMIDVIIVVVIVVLSGSDSSENIVKTGVEGKR